MRMYQALILFLGLAFNEFVVMMNKGATLANLSVGKRVGYGLIITAVNALALLAGYALSVAFKGILSSSGTIAAAYLILFCMGIFITVHAYYRRDTVEKLDREFDNMQCLILSLKNAYGILLVGAGCFLLGVSLPNALCLSSVMSFIFMVGALDVGYRYGSTFSRTVGMTGGILIVIFTVLRFMQYIGFGG